MQKKAFELNGALFVPPDGTAYHRLADRGVSQAALSLRYRLSFENANAFVSEAHSSCDHLAFGIEAHSFESALNDVAKIIGISSNRPEATIGKGPDCLWMGDNGTYFIIEAKSEVELTRTEIHKSETEQLTCHSPFIPRPSSRMRQCFRWTEELSRRMSSRRLLLASVVSLLRFQQLKGAP